MIDEIRKIMDILNDIEYGFKENDINIITNQGRWDNEFENFYYLQTPNELLKSKCGVCWDQVELERKLFHDINIPIKTYFIYMKEKDNLPSHTFLVFSLNNKYYWFEHSWNKYKGIHEYNTEEELLDSVSLKFIEEHKNICKKNKIYLYEYNKPKIHISCNDFYKYIETQNRIK